MQDDIFNIVGIKRGFYHLYSDNNNATRYRDSYAVEVMRRFKDKVTLYVFQDKRLFWGECDFFQWVKECNADFAEAIAESKSVFAKWDISNNEKIEKIINCCVEQATELGRYPIIMGDEIINMNEYGRAEIMDRILNIKNATIISTSRIPSLRKCLGEFGDRINAINLNNVLFENDYMG